MKVLHILYKVGSNSISLLAQSFENSNMLNASIYDCDSGKKKWFWEVVNISKEYEIVHFHSALTFLAIPFIRVLSKTTKVVITVHDIGFKYKRHTAGFFKSLVLELFSIIGHACAHRIIFVSKAAQKQNWLNFLNSSNSVISNGVGRVPKKEKEIKTATTQLFFIGNHFYVKGLNNLIKFEKPLSSTIHLFGDILEGANTQDLNKFEQWKRNSDIIENGHVQNTVLTNFMKSANAIFLLLSTSEASPISVIECMQYGVPIIATNLPVFSEYGINELVHKVDNSNKTSLQKAVDMVNVGYKEISKKMKMRYKENFTSECYIQNHIALYTTLLTYN